MRYLLERQAGLLTEQLTLSRRAARGGAPHPGLLQRVQLDSVEQRPRQERTKVTMDVTMETLDTVFPITLAVFVGQRDAAAQHPTLPSSSHNIVNFTL